MGSPFSRDSVEEGAAFPESGTWLQALSSEELFLLGLLQALYGSLRLLKAEKHICSMCIYLKCQPFAPLPPSFFKACIHILRSRNTLPRYTLPQLSVPALWSSRAVVGSTAGPGVGDCTGEALSLARAVVRFCSLPAGRSSQSWDHPLVLGICLLLVGFL